MTSPVCSSLLWCLAMMSVSKPRLGGVVVPPTQNLTLLTDQWPNTVTLPTDLKGGVKVEQPEMTLEPLEEWGDWGWRVVMVSLSAGCGATLRREKPRRDPENKDVGITMEVWTKRWVSPECEKCGIKGGWAECVESKYSNTLNSMLKPDENLVYTQGLFIWSGFEARLKVHLQPPGRRQTLTCWTGCFKGIKEFS